MDLDKHSFNIKIIGPGIWFFIHSLALSSTSIDDQNFFKIIIYKIINGLPCKRCKNHGLIFWEKNPIENYYNITDKEKGKIGLFKWSWEFHEAANKGLKKKGLSFDKAYQLYKNMPLCKNCDNKNITKKSGMETKTKAS